MKQQKSQLAPAPPACSTTMTLPQFLSAHNQSSYAAAVRRSPNRSPLSLWRTDSRCSSPTAGLSSRLSTLHLGSKGSSPSSTTSESASERERERPLSACALQRPRNPYFGMSLCPVSGRDARKCPTTAGHSPGQKTSRNAQHGWRPRSNSTTGVLYQTQPRTIPGMSPINHPKEEPEEAKANEGGWIKVERQKKPQRQPESKPFRGRGRRGGRGGGRGRIGQ